MVGNFCEAVADMKFVCLKTSDQNLFCLNDVRIFFSCFPLYSYDHAARVSWYPKVQRSWWCSSRFIGNRWPRLSLLLFLQTSQGKRCFLSVVAWTWKLSYNCLFCLLKKYLEENIPFPFYCVKDSQIAEDCPMRHFFYMEEDVPVSLGGRCMLMCMSLL